MLKKTVSTVAGGALIAGCLTLGTTTAAHAADGGTQCINNPNVLTCLWVDLNYTGYPSAVVGPKIHGALPVYNQVSPFNNSVSSVVSVPWQTAYTYYYDLYNGAGNPMFILGNNWMWALLPDSYNDKISSIWITASNL
jgi:hypothetical protein